MTLVPLMQSATPNLQQAKTAAATIVKPFYEEVGWHVRVSWEGVPLTIGPHRSNAIRPGQAGANMSKEDSYSRPLSLKRANSAAS